jgi:phosphoribosylglycinamide formyltransferase-1
MNVAVIASHQGSTLQAVIDAFAHSASLVRVAVVISNNSTSGALAKARAAGIPCHHLSGKTHPAPEKLDTAICSAIDSAQTDLVFLAGYMRKLGPLTLTRFRGRILNTHPALLPKFGGQGMYGMRVHEAVLASGERTTGASVHLVDGDYDTGPVVAQTCVPVDTGDSAELLAARVQSAERALVVQVLRDLASGALLLPSASDIASC